MLDKLVRTVGRDEIATLPGGNSGRWLSTAVCADEQGSIQLKSAMEKTVLLRAPGD